MNNAAGCCGIGLIPLDEGGVEKAVGAAAFAAARTARGVEGSVAR